MILPGRSANSSRNRHQLINQWFGSNLNLLQFAMLLLFANAGYSQQGNFALGLRLGSNTPNVAPGISGKYFLKDDQAVEAIFGWNDGISFCGLYQWHKPVSTVGGLHWYAGAGAYTSFRFHAVNLGITGVAGLDYQFADIPLNMAVDWKPELNLLGTLRFEPSGIGLSVRYAFHRNLHQSH